MKKKILFVINNLGGGGAEKILLDTVKNLNHNKYIVDVCTIFNDGIYDGEIQEYINKLYNIYDINKYSPRIRLMVKKILLRKIKFWGCGKINKVEKYDVEIAYLEGAATKLVSKKKSNALKLAWVHVDPIKLPYSTKYFRSLKEEKKCYKNFDKILCVSEDVKDSFLEKYFVNENVCVQLNVLDDQEILKRSMCRKSQISIDQDKFTMVSVGRLVPQKSYLRLLQAVNKIHNVYKNIELIIIGEGDERQELEKYMNDHNMNGYVKLPGFFENPFPLIKQCDLFVCSSITEGFSTAVCEAIILGLPILSTDCAGMKDIIGNSGCGMIVDNTVKGLVEGLKIILGNQAEYIELKKNAKIRKEFFNIQNRIEELEQLLDDR